MSENFDQFFIGNYLSSNSNQGMDHLNGDADSSRSSDELKTGTSDSGSYSSSSGKDTVFENGHSSGAFSLGSYAEGATADAAGLSIKTEPLDGDLQQEVHSTQKKLKSPTKPLKDKTCLVCGDKALGYNFNAISCESCKAFFRRNAYKEIRGRCEGKCDVTVESRSYCKKCRLQKCVTVGMKKDLILNDSQKNVRRQKIHENRLRRMGIPVPVGSDSDSRDPTSSGIGSSEPPVIKIEDDPKTHCIASEVKEEMMEGLSEHVQERIQEVMRAFQLSFDAPVDKAPIQSPSNADFLNMADASVRRLVKMAKQLVCFKRLDQDDQIALLKGAVVEVLILRSAKMFDTQSLGWSVNKGGTQHSVSASALQFGNQESIEFFKQYHKFAMNLLMAMHHDNIILMIMIVLAVLSPDRPNIKMKEDIAAAQELYASTLQEYISVRYPEDPLILPRVLQKLADIRELNEIHTKMLLHMRVEDLEPLVVEIFDLNA